MQLQLTEQDARELHAFLNSQLPTLRREVARTDSRELRHMLVERLNVVERVMEDLAAVLGNTVAT